MAAEQFILEGTWEEIAPQLARFAGRRLRRIIIPEDAIESVSRPPSKSIEETLIELAAKVPNAEWNKLPSDLSDNLDDYIYGTLKPASR